MGSAPAALHRALRGVDALLALATAGAVFAIWRAGETSKAAGVTASPPLAQARSAETRRPPRALALALGAPSAKAYLTSGFLAPEQNGGRSVVRAAGARAVLALRLAPDASGEELSLLLRTLPGASESKLALSVNGHAAGTIVVGADWGLRHVALPAPLLVAGTNLLELVSSAPKPGFLLDRLWLRPAAARTELAAGAGALLDVGTAEARANLLGGFSNDEVAGADDFAWSDAEASSVAFFLEPERRPYWLSLRGHTLVPLAPLVVSLKLNGQPLSALEVGAAPATYDVALPAAVLVSGKNVLELAYAATKQPRSVVPGSRDTRSLALQLDWLDVAPRPD